MNFKITSFYICLQIRCDVPSGLKMPVSLPDFS